MSSDLRRLCIVIHMLEYRNQLELSVEGRLEARDHLRNLGAHVNCKGLGPSRESACRVDGRLELDAVVGVESVADAVMHLFSLWDNHCQGAKRP